LNVDFARLTELVVLVSNHLVDDIQSCMKEKSWQCGVFHTGFHHRSSSAVAPSIPVRVMSFVLQSHPT
jgi:hypothetical protein